jgi:beta-galactosidase
VTTRWLVVVAVAGVSCGASAVLAQPRSEVVPPTTTRVRLTINDGWRYATGPLDGAEAPGFSDSLWARVALPHTWNADDAFTKALEYRRGQGWYRRRLTLAPELRGRRLFLYFEGANQVADVYVNGRAAGRHVGGYTAFSFDITDFARFDSPNVIAVRVDNSHDPAIPPLNADFTFYGGIYRDVWLVATDPVHVTVTDHASPGIFVDTPDISRTAATVRVRGTVVNATGTQRRVRVSSRVLDDAGRAVATLVSTVTIAPNASAAFEQRSATVPNPRLWSPATPTLYRVHTEVHDGRRLTDKVDAPLGFRWIAVDARRGFLLNGEPLPLRGTNRHQDREGFANALPDWAHREDVRHVKSAGFNFLRLAHYPQDPVVLDEADRQGLVIWEEIPVVNLISMSETFAENSERMLVEMIRQHYNHPSVALWGYMNEVLLQPPRPEPPGYRASVVALARRLEARVHAEDSTRRTVTAISIDEIDNGTGLQDISDVVGFNLYFGWYYRTLEGLGPYLDSLHQRYPKRPLMVSEYGADSDERIHTRSPRAFDFSNEFRQRFHEANYAQLAARDYLVGTAVWNQFDFGVKGRHDSKPNLNQKGLHYFDRTPKDVAYYYRARLLAEPVLRLAVRDWSIRAGSREADRLQPIKVYSNLSEVELFLGDSSLGRRRTENATAEWNVSLVAGPNRFRASGVAPNGTAVEDEATVHYEDRSSFFRDPMSPVRVVAVNAGSHYDVVEASGTVWEADRAYERGGWGYVGEGRPVLIHHRIFGTVADDPIFQAARDSVRAYRFDVPDGDYEVRVRLAETHHEHSARRVFDVHVNDVPVFSAIDLAGEYGRYVAVERAVEVTARAGRGLELRFAARVGAPIVNGILIRRR